MTATDPARLARTLTKNEKAALLSLPVRDGGGLPEEAWWAYYAIFDAGLSTTAGDLVMVPTPLGEAVIEHLAAAGDASS